MARWERSKLSKWERSNLARLDLYTIYNAATSSYVSFLLFQLYDKFVQENILTFQDLFFHSWIDFVKGIEERNFTLVGKVF